MLSPALVLLAGLALIALLFAVAAWGERGAARLGRAWPLVYVLSLGVHCTGWTFYGTTTQADRWGVILPPTFLGVIAACVFGLPFLTRLAEIARAQNSASLADLVAARLGKDSRIAVIITAVAVFGMVPYIALQLKAVAISYAAIASGAKANAGWQDLTLWVAAMMAAFAMLFGTRRAAATEHNQGLVLAIAFESLLKLLAMLAVGAFAVWSALGGVDGVAAAAAAQPARHLDGGFFSLIALGAMALVIMPHQFHVGTVELRDPRHLRTARWGFPLYLVAIGLPMLPLAIAGRAAFGDAMSTDLYVIALPLAADRSWLALSTFLGGLGAATGMVILSALTLSIMLAQHWLAPLTLRPAARQDASHDLRPLVLGQRRLGILAILALAWLYSRAMAASASLADIGVLSFSALAHLMPAVLAAVYRPTAPARALTAGIVAGIAVWIWLLLVPVAEQAGVLALPTVGAPWSWAMPEQFLGLGSWDRLARGVVASLAVNLVVVMLAARRPRDAARLAFPISIGALHKLSARFLPSERLVPLFTGSDAGAGADDALVERCEHELAAVIGAASARLLVDAARRGDAAPLDRVAAVVDETSQALRFNQQLLEAALQNMSQGISVVDRELRLTAWNERYARLFDYPPELLRVGTPVSALVRYNAARGLLGDGDGTELIERRLAHMRSGTPYVTERRFPDGTVVEIRGMPMPGGGFVATFTDITAFRHTEAALRQVNETLEQRVAERTAESEAARDQAQQANRAKSRFLAAISHDLLQPLNAAHLFTHALGQQLSEAPHREAVANIDSALSSTESLLSGLLDISRLDSGGLAPRIGVVDLGELLRSLAVEFRVLAAARGLVLAHVPVRAFVRSDVQLLRRVLQNFLSNAVRYSERGRILLGVRRAGGAVRVEVWDSGPGIPEAARELIFEEFQRLPDAAQRPGLGLGLAIADRMARLLGHPLTLRSWPGRGSVFAITVPRAPAPAPARASEGGAARLTRCVLAIDNDPDGLRALAALLRGWGATVLCAHGVDDLDACFAAGTPELLLIDYHLDRGDTGLALRARDSRLAALPSVLVTADHGQQVQAEAQAAGVALLHKPLRPLALKSVVNQLLARTSAGAA